MKQTRRMSAVEAAANTAVGFLLSWALSAIVYPLCGIQASQGQTLLATLAFTLLSALRSYAMRRLFERLHPHRPRSVP
jgi:membrane protein implicated in regulation of membrane protease activity